ncbi:MAG TPA: UvrD-helicase domain-containing protein [Longimicrobiales bacterium]|nr:UvrD-helicase domain-containing protein [Longimicrobiales bacterium]
MSELFLLPDAIARERIANELDKNLLVEAGAGAGKTTEMIKRMIALIARDCADVSQIAAVTFTRKAAAELRERFQNDLEKALRNAVEKDDAPLAQRLNRALRDIDTGFIGTIHAFCARMLREHPIEAGLDPDFHEVVEVEELVLRRQAWARACERLAHDDASELRDLVTVGLKPAQLEPLFHTMCDYVDVDFPSSHHARPDPTNVRDRLERLIDEANQVIPNKRPHGGWDDLQKRIRTISFKRGVLSWNDEGNFFDALEKTIALSRAKLTVVRWGEAKEEAKQLHEKIKHFAADGGEPASLLAEWFAYRYPYAIAFARKCAAYYANDRLRVGKLNFQDLLMFATKLLREHPGARKALGHKYRFALVDEFQDTDPIQAELLFLLASDDCNERNWHQAQLRPGALFVVGDPKQSIYRFRRADIGIYNQVKARFADGQGVVLQLTANFRSTKPIETFVNSVFSELLPAEATEQQAAFTPMVTQKAGKPKHGARCSGFEVAIRRHDVIAQADAERLATWIANRIKKGQRTPGDFLLLTTRKATLQVYARALEARDVPVEVTGASVGLEEELHELVILLEALSDPSNAALTVAALLGLFFGIDYDQLLSHKLAGGKFNFIDEQALPETDILKALKQLREWWQITRREPSDVALPRIVEDIGLLPHAAGGDLGTTRAGALLFALDAVRAAGLNGDTSLRAAIEAIRVATEAAEAEAPLEPGRDDVVRVMNVHKAKGLEAPVVLLAFPTGDWQGTPTLRVERRASGVAQGFVRIEERAESFTMRTLAQPLEWPRYAELETEFDRAEDIRLLYVAATRAAEELVVSRCYESEDKSPWRKLYPHFSDEQRGEIEIKKPPARQRLLLDANDIARRIGAVADLRAEAAKRSYVATAVKDIARKTVIGGEVLEPLPLPRTGAPRGIEWGSIVHAALEVAARGANAQKIEIACRGLLHEYDRPLDPETGQPAELNELLGIVQGMTKSDIWKRAMRSGNALVEVPFAVNEPEDEINRTVEGVIDLAFREKDGWVIVDYKTDAIADPDAWQQRTETYRRQVNLYADYWESLTGDPVVERVLVLTSVGHELKWGKTGQITAQQLDLNLA